MKRSSIKKRILLWFGGVTALVLIVFSFAFYYFLNKNISLKLQAQLFKQAKEVEYKLASGTSIEQLLKQGLRYNNAIAFGKQGRVVKKSDNFSLDHPDTYLQGADTFYMLKSEQYVKGVYVLTLKPPMQGRLLITTPDTNNMVEDAEDTLLFLIPMLLLMLLFLGSRLIDKIMIPIQGITRSTQAININYFSSTIPLPKENDEIKDLVVSFNDMIKRLKEGVNNLNRFNSDVSHELKTPLTVIKGEIEISLRKLREPDAYIESMHTIAYEANQIEMIVEDLLLLTKYSKENISQTFEKCQVDAVLLQTLDKYDPLLKAKHLTLVIDKLESVSLDANPLLLTSIFSNLVENAIKYTPENRTITVSLYRDEKAHFTICDEGIGIDKKNLDKITNRFYRADPSRNKKIKGFGLGLSIVQNSVELHNGTMEILSQPDQGMTVHIIL